MRSWILTLALVGTTGGGVAFVLAGKGTLSHCGPCLEAKASQEVPAESPCDGDICPTCKPGSMDLVDLSALLASASNGSRPHVSFEEPPFAQPTKARVKELAPQPRAVVEVCPMPRLQLAELAPMPHESRN